MMVVNITEFMCVLVEMWKEIECRSPQWTVSPAMPINAVVLQDRVVPHRFDKVPDSRVIPKATNVEDLQIVVDLISYI